MPTVLLIDDSKTIQKVAALILKGSAYRLLTAEDSESGKKLALREKPDVALVDFTLAPKNGLDLIGEFSDEPSLRGMKSALLYSHFNNLNPTELEKVRAAGKLAKPFDADEFWDLLKSLKEQPSAFQLEKKDEILGIPSLAPSDRIAPVDPLKNLFTEEDLDKCLNFSEKSLTALQVSEGIFCQDEKTSETTPAKEFLCQTRRDEMSEGGVLEVRRAERMRSNDVWRKKAELAVERICREVIPPLAEKIIREEIQKLIKESH